MSAALEPFRRGRPAHYPDQTVYAAYACAELGLRFMDLAGGNGTLFAVVASRRKVCFGAGAVSAYPQNSATACDLATDKHFSNGILESEGLPTLGGQYFFLTDRFKAHRGPGHEKADAFAYLAELGGTCFAKPLRGSRGDFAQPIHGQAALGQYLESVSRHFDAVILQPIFAGDEYRVFVMDGEVIYAARKEPPVVLGDGSTTLRDLLVGQTAALRAHGVSSVLTEAELDRLGGGDRVPADGERVTLAGRMNRSAGGRMRLAAPDDASAAFDLALRATSTHGLRVAGIDLFMPPAGTAGEPRIIEVNQNPSIRLLEDSDRPDLILAIWMRTFRAIGLLDV